MAYWIFKVMVKVKIKVKVYSFNKCRKGGGGGGGGGSRSRVLRFAGFVRSLFCGGRCAILDIHTSQSVRTLRQ